TASCRGARSMLRCARCDFCIGSRWDPVGESSAFRIHPDRANCRRHCAAKLALCRRLLGADEAKTQPDERIEDYRVRYETLTGASLIACPICRSGRIIRIETLSSA